MERGPTTALLEFLSCSTWTRVVAPNLWHRATEGRSVIKRLPLNRSLCFEVTVNPSHPCSSTHNQFLAVLSADCFLVGSHFRIGVVFVRQGKYGQNPAAVLFVIQESSPVCFAELHSTYEAFCPIVGMSNAATIFRKQWQKNVARMQGIGNDVQMT